MSVQLNSVLNDIDSNWYELVENLFDFFEQYSVVDAFKNGQLVDDQLKNILHAAANNIGVNKISISPLMDSDWVESGVSNNQLDLDKKSQTIKVKNQVNEVIFTYSDLSLVDLNKLKRFSEFYFQSLSIQIEAYKQSRFIKGLYKSLHQYPLPIVILDHLNNRYFCNASYSAFIGNKNDSFDVYSKWIVSGINNKESSGVVSGCYFSQVALSAGFEPLQENSDISSVVFIYPLKEFNFDACLLSEKISSDLLDKGLTDKEAKLALYIAGGKTPSEYSKIVSRSIKTIQTQVKSIFKKLGIHSQQELMHAVYDINTRVYLKHVLGVVS